MKHVCAKFPHELIQHVTVWKQQPRSVLDAEQLISTRLLFRVSPHHLVLLQRSVWLSEHLVIRVMFKVAANVSTGKQPCVRSCQWIQLQHQRAIFAK